MPVLKVPATIENLVVVNKFIAEHLPYDCMALQKKVQLVAEELLVNVFMYAYLGALGEAEIGCKNIFFDNQEYFCLWVKDTGKAFNPFLEAMTPNTNLDVEHRPVGGLGIHLIKSVVSHYAYSYTDGINHIELYFKKENAC